MKIIRSKITGYCHGVENTIRKASKVLKLAKSKGVPAYSIGKLIHNDDAASGFENQGLKIIHDADVQPGVALVRAHGISVEQKRKFEERGFVLIDSTCENIIATVHKIHNAEKEGRHIVVVGVKNHDETNTLLGCSKGEKSLVSSVNDLNNLLEALDENCAVSVAVQTTFSSDDFAVISAALKEHFKDIVVLNNLCMACIARKANGKKLAHQCDAMFVVGGKESANTKELASCIEQTGKPVYLIQNENDFNADLDLKVKAYKTVGICSGTSTPSSVIDGVIKHLENL